MDICEPPFPSGICGLLVFFDTVDFPARLEGREVYLCWQLGEPEVLHWHAMDAGFAGRQPIFAPVGSPGAYEDEDTA